MLASLLLAVVTATSGSTAAAQACLSLCSQPASQEACIMVDDAADAHGCCPSEGDQVQTEAHASGCGKNHTDAGCGCATCSQALSYFYRDRAPADMPSPAKFVAAAPAFTLPIIAPTVLQDAARSVGPKRHLTHVELCVYLC